MSYECVGAFDRKGPNSVHSFLDPMEKNLTESSVKKEYSPRKKSAAAKRAMGDAHCDDQESSHELQKRLKLSKEECYDAIHAMREGRDDRATCCIQK